jgi:hypothetical protein
VAVVVKEYQLPNMEKKDALARPVMVKAKLQSYPIGTRFISAVDVSRNATK